MGIEPTSSAWEAEALPLNYTRVGSPYTNTSDATSIWVGDSGPLFALNFATGNYAGWGV